MNQHTPRGWKRGVQDIDAALSRTPEHPKEDS